MTTAHDLFLELETSLFVLKNSTQFLAVVATVEGTDTDHVAADLWQGILELTARESSRADALLSDYWKALKSEKI